MEIRTDSLLLNINNQLVKKYDSNKFLNSRSKKAYDPRKSAKPEYSKNFTKNALTGQGHPGWGLKPIQPIGLEVADSASLEKLPGIGPVLSARIIKYRDKLGGFHEKSQLKEVYGLSDSVFEKITPYLKVNQTKLQQIEINQVSETQLAKHPYVQWKLAKQLIRYRESHGPFQTINDLYSLWGIDSSRIKKLTPYLFIRTDSSDKK